MIGAGSAKFGQSWCVLGIDEAQDFLVVLYRPNKTLLAAHLPAKPRQDAGKNFATRFLRQSCMQRASKRGFIPTLFRVFLFDELGRPINEVQRAEITFAIIVGPIDEAVLAH